MKNFGLIRSVSLVRRADSRLRRRGLTLIELVMVLVILAALAATIVPIVDNIRRTSDKATSAAAIKQVVENLSLYRTTTAHYPDRLDSLITSGTATLFSSLHDKLDNATEPKLAVSALTEKEAEGLEEAGIEVLLDHDLTNAERGLPGNSGLVPRAVADTQNVAVLNLANEEGLEVTKSIYPQLGAVGSGYTVDATNNVITVDPDLTASSGDEYTIKLVCLGVGPGNKAIGNTMVSAPAYQSVDAVTTYNRYIAVFAVYDGTVGKEKLAQIKGALDSKGDFLNEELAEIAENASK